MKLIRFYTRPENMENIREKLFEMGAPGLSVTDALGIGKPLGQMTHEKGEPAHLPQFRKRICVEVVADDKDTQALAASLAELCRTGKFGDGKIFIINVDDAIRVRTGERGADSLY
ncbi:Nitrogen regulatory protein P-II [hydrothermal vent metagenome]|uniref:Nitrogen regulatory protein P-II n=1 Tax=hydrothermal vent metagenome TaxID=652676 RepID=A0A3B1C1I6_9ZZZZ